MRPIHWRLTRKTTELSRLNFEEQNQYQVRIQFSHRSKLSERDFLITIEDINESPYNLRCSNQLGICTVFDDDFNQTLKLEIKTVNNLYNETLFEIICSDNGQPSLSVSTWTNAIPNDMTLMYVPNFLLIIPVDDDNDTRYKHTRDNIVISYSTDGDKTEQQRQRRQANSPPQDISFNMFHLSVPENSRNFNLANVSVVDEDNDNYTCSIQTLDAPQHHQPFEIINGILRTKLTMNNNNYDLDFETVPVYHTSVSCSDLTHHFTINKNFTIFVSDVNEAPVELRLSPHKLPENSPAGYIIGQLFTIDPDIFSINQTFQYTIITDTSNIFRLDNDKLILSRENYVEMCMVQPDVCPHDYEQTSSLLVRILVEDNGEPKVSQKFWIQVMVTDENDPPINLFLDKNTVKENSPIGTLVGSFSVEDQDIYQTQTYTLISENSFSERGYLFAIEDNDLRLLRSPDYEQEQFILITVQATDNGVPPKSVTSDFLIEILDVDELPSTYLFISNNSNNNLNDTIDILIDGINPVRTIYLPQNAYFHSSIGEIFFLMEDRDRDINLNGYSYNLLAEFGFEKPDCNILTEIPYRLLCKSTVTIANPHSEYDSGLLNGHLVVTSLTLTSDNTTMTFSKPLRIKFENITLTINGQRTESIDIPKQNSASIIIGSIDALDLAAGGQHLANVTLNGNSSLSYPLEMINSTMLKIRDDVNFTSYNLPSIFNVSILVTTNGEDSRIVEKILMIHVKDKYNFNLTLTNNKVMENSHENTLIGSLILENGVGNYTIELINDSEGRFKLDHSYLLTAKQYFEHCHVNHTCSLNHEIEPIINVTIAVLDSLTNETLRVVNFSIEIQDENEVPFNLTLSNLVVSENTTIGSTVSIISAIDVDFNQTVTFTTINPTFTITDNRLRLKKKLNYDTRQFIPIIIQATDNGQPPTFTEKLFVINVTANNRPPTNVTSNVMIDYIGRNSENKNSTPSIIGQLLIVDPDVNENFTITFDKPNFQVLDPAINSYSIISNDGFELSAQIYNVSIVALDSPREEGQEEYVINVTANITDSAGHLATHEFSVNYIRKLTTNSTTISTFIETATEVESLRQALHIRIYETTTPDTPIIRGLLRSPSSNNSLSTALICTVADDQGYLFNVNTTNTNQLEFIIFVPINYILNSTIRPTIVLSVFCYIGNDTNVNQDIVVDVLPAPPTVEINFNQTKIFYAANPISNDTILGTFDLIELTTISSNRTYNLSLVNHQDIFQLSPNNSLIQIGQYSSEILQLDNPHVNLTIQAIETTSNKPIRFIQKTFHIPIIVNSSVPSITFSQSSITNTTRLNITIGNFTVNNLAIPYQLQLIDTFDNGLELDHNTNTLVLKRPINTFPLKNNQTQLKFKVALINETNGTILTTSFPLRFNSETILDTCSYKDCGNGTCIIQNNDSAYCLCTGGFTGIDCRDIDACAYSPCINNGICHQFSFDGNFSCLCKANYSGTYCEIPIDVCQLNKSSCPSTYICIPIYNNLMNSFTCIPRGEIQYFVFDYLNVYKTIDIVNNEKFPKNIENFIKDTFLLNETIVLPERRILGPQKYNRAQLISVAVQISKDSLTTFNNALEIFCANLSSIMDSFADEICAGYHQAAYLDKYFKSIPNFCPNCTFAEAADKYYWFDKIIPFLPLWITVIIGSLIIAAFPLIPFSKNTPKKVTLPLMKANRGLKEEESLSLVKSVRSAVKTSHYSYRKRNDSGYESNEDDDNYLEQIINNHQEEFHTYPVSLRRRSRSIERRGTTIDDIISQNNSPNSRFTSLSNNPRRYVQRSVSMSAHKTPRQPSIGQSQTLKPIIRRRSTLFDTSLGSLIRLTGTPRLNNDDDTYMSSRFRNENTSKFVIGTLWNTFALINNLFLQRPRNRRNALSGDTNIQAEQLAHLEQLYSLAERDQANEIATNHLESILTDILSELKTNKTKNLQSTMLDILSSTESNHCTCYRNHHLPTCMYYDHSLPYHRHFIGSTSQLEKIFRDIQKFNQPKGQDAATQSSIEKPHRIFKHCRPTTNASTQSSPIFRLKQLYCHASTQYSPIQDKTNIPVESNLNEINDMHFNYSNIHVATQTIENRPSLTDISTQFSPIAIENKDHINSLIQQKLRTNTYDDHMYINASTQFSPVVNEYVLTNSKSQIIHDVDVRHINVSTQFTPITVEDIATQYSQDEIDGMIPKQINTFNRVNSKVIQDNSIHEQRNSLMNELKQALAEPIPKQQITENENLEKTPLHTHSVRSLVSMFETTSLPNKSDVNINSKPFKKFSNNTQKIRSPLNSERIHTAIEETYSSIANDVIEQYANEMASNIVDNAVLSTLATTIYHKELEEEQEKQKQQQQQRRFSFYNNGGGQSKSLLFQSNTFVPTSDTINQENKHDFRAESAASSTLLNDQLTLTIRPVTEYESQHTLIVGRYVDGNDTNQSKPKKRHSFTNDPNSNLSSSSSSSLIDEKFDNQQYLSSSQLFSAQKVYIRPWIVRRATIADIHCLDNNINDTRVESKTAARLNSSETFFNHFPNNYELDITTRYTCLITILLYLEYIHDENSNKILFDELEDIEERFINDMLTPSKLDSNVFQTVNPDGSKRYRTGFILDVNSSDSTNKPTIFAKQIDWKRVKIVIRRFRKKIQRQKQLIKNDKKKNYSRSDIENYFKYFDSKSKHRMKKYAKHYAEKL